MSKNWGVYWARREGYYAGLKGKPQSENPSPPGTPLHDRWKGGWEDGHAARERGERPTIVRAM